MLRIVAKFHEEVFSDPDCPTGLNEVSIDFISLFPAHGLIHRRRQRLDFQEITSRHDEELTRYFDDWDVRFRTESDMNG
jgi:hypothetical protein